MKHLRYTDEALDDISRIADYVALAAMSLQAGESLAQRIVGKCEKLATLPGPLGRARPELRLDLRSTAFGNYVIFFRYFGDVMEVVNVLEGHRGIEDYFSDD